MSATNAIENAATAVKETAQATVETITEAVKNTSLNPTKTDNSEADATQSAAAAEGRRLYIGNLAFSTTDEQLKEFFSGYSVYVISTLYEVHLLICESQRVHANSHSSPHWTCRWLCFRRSNDEGGS